MLFDISPRSEERGDFLPDDRAIITSHVRATRHLHPAVAATVSSLTDEEKNRASDFRRQAAKKLKLAKILFAEELPDEAADALRESVRLAGCAFAVEARAIIPSTLAVALASLIDVTSRALEIAGA